jgi:uncharacterized protein
MLNEDRWEERCEEFLGERLRGDQAHGLDHVRRVVANARRLAAAEGARLEVVLPAAWLHDCEVAPKDSPHRSTASARAARTAREWLESVGYPSVLLDEIEHAIAAHSFSAGLSPHTIEAKVVQDADRLDALGAVGIARCMMVGGNLGRPLYDPDDPFCERRDAKDSVSTIDHFYTKLLRLSDSMQTESGRREAARRTEFMRSYLQELAAELAIEKGD